MQVVALALLVLALAAAPTKANTSRRSVRSLASNTRHGKHGANDIYIDGDTQNDGPIFPGHIETGSGDGDLDDDEDEPLKPVVHKPLPDDDDEDHSRGLLPPSPRGELDFSAGSGDGEGVPETGGEIFIDKPSKPPKGVLTTEKPSFVKPEDVFPEPTSGSGGKSPQLL